MLFSDSYLTVASEGKELYKDKGSKFYAYVFPVKNETEIKEKLQILKKEHPSATHHCYAWRLGADKAAFRANDDGEPANTAGKPILMQIQSHDLSNVLIVVVRYFGGTLLGVGGLIQAYRSAAQTALSGVNIVERFIYFEYQIDFDFESMSQVMRVLKEMDAKIISSAYNEHNTIVFHIKKQDSEKLEARFKELYTTKLRFIAMI